MILRQLGFMLALLNADIYHEACTEATDLARRKCSDERAYGHEFAFLALA